jgi:hypothetical protein
MWQKIRTCYREELLMSVLWYCYGGVPRASGQFAGLCERTCNYLFSEWEENSGERMAEKRILLLDLTVL